MVPDFRDLYSFDDDIPDSDAPIEFRFIRQDGGKKLSLVCNSSRLYCIPTHWIGSKQVPHRKLHCECELKPMERRYYGFFAGILQATGEQVICECTAGAAKTIVTYQKANGDIRGHLITLTRLGDKKTAKQHAAVLPPKGMRVQLPEEIDVRGFLLRMWKVPEVNTVRFSEFDDINMTDDEKVKSGIDTVEQKQEFELCNHESENSVELIRGVLKNYENGSLKWRQ
jgi:hypothetical protein